MSRSFSMCGKGPRITVRFTPPLTLEDGAYDFALVGLQTTNKVLNIREGVGNTLDYSDEKNAYVLKVPDGTYLIDDINRYIYSVLRAQFPKEFKNKTLFRSPRTQHTCVSH